MFFFLAAFFLYYRLRLFQEPSGADGFFYLKQIQSLSESFSFYYQDYSFAFFIPSILNLVLNNPLLSFQLTCILVWAGIGFLVLKLAEIEFTDKVSKTIFSIFLVILLSVNTLAIDLSFVFLKTAVGLFFFLLSLKTWKDKKFYVA